MCYNEQKSKFWLFTKPSTLNLWTFGIQGWNSFPDRPGFQAARLSSLYILKSSYSDTFSLPSITQIWAGENHAFFRMVTFKELSRFYSS